MNHAGQKSTLKKALLSWLEYAEESGFTTLSPPSLRERIHGLRGLHRTIQACRLCPLHTNRKQAVLGYGNPFSPIVFVGEGPGHQEDIEGQPFVGRAGQLLTHALARFGIPRDAVYIANVVKCRPEGNRTPRPSEMQACFPYLQRQLSLIRPRLIVPMGNPALQMILGQSGITRLRGQWFQKGSVKIFPIYHPAFVLRNLPQHIPVFYRDIRAVATFYWRLKSDGR